MWFEKLMGFEEVSPEQVRDNIVLEGNTLVSKINNNKYTCGSLDICTLEDLRNMTQSMDIVQEKLSLLELVGDISLLHRDVTNQGAIFQAASQFNLLEMVGPQVTPEKGVGIYEYDKTQGPACAIACGAGTIYRNYFVKIGDQIGQSENNQIDCLDELGKYFGNENYRLWKMQNGYVFARREGLFTINQKLQSLSEKEYQLGQGKVKVGVQRNTQVTLSTDEQLVNQVYCSALPIAYSAIEYQKWESFARFILEATYEATFHVAVHNYFKTGNPNLFLTLVGGNAFGNPSYWILDAIKKSLIKFKNIPLQVKMVSYNRSNPETIKFIQSYNKFQH